MKFRNPKYQDISQSMPCTVDTENKHRILSALESFTRLAEKCISDNPNLPVDSIYNAILQQFSDNNTRIFTQRMQNVFEKEPRDSTNFTRNLTVLLMLMKRFWHYNPEFEACLKKYTHKTGMGAQSLFISSLDL